MLGYGHITIGYLKNMILAQGQGGREVPTGGILKYFEDCNRAPNAEIGPKDIFEIAYKNYQMVAAVSIQLRQAAIQEPGFKYRTDQHPVLIDSRHTRTGEDFTFGEVNFIYPGLSVWL